MLHTNSGNLLETLEHLNEVVKVHDNGVAGRQDLNLAQEVRRVTDILSGSVIQSGADIRVAIDQDLRIRFNPAYLESILINLISNALKYRHPGPGSLHPDRCRPHARRITADHCR